jgi:hypothetical protein
MHFTAQRARFDELETPVASGRVNFHPLFKQEDCHPALLYHSHFGCSAPLNAVVNQDRCEDLSECVA